MHHYWEYETMIAVTGLGIGLAYHPSEWEYHTVYIENKGIIRVLHRRLKKEI